MDDPFTMPYLESLSTAELAALADGHGLDIPPDLERVFMLGELLEYGDFLRRRGGAAPKLDPPAEAFREPAALPERYGAPFVDVIVRDPLWVFAFWETKKPPADAGDAGPGSGDAAKGHFLRVVPLGGGDGESFTVDVGAANGSLYVGVPRLDVRSFRLDLCARRGEGHAVIAESGEFRMPRHVGDGEGDAELRAVHENPLARLSGAGSFMLARSVDRAAPGSDG